MILHPAILALLIGALLTCFMMLYAGWYGVRILRNWDLQSGSELQLELERRTYLISTLVSYSLTFELISLFLLIYTADRLHILITGAMCAAGTLNANAFGYPLLLLKIVNFLLAGVWLIVNHADNRGHDYPLIRVKYAGLIAIAPLSLYELYYLYAYFSELHADVITSCCGSLFSLERPGISGDLASLPSAPMMIVFYVVMAATLLSGVYCYRTGRGGYLFSALSCAAFVVGIASIVSFISLYIYELPSHHCPFDILQKEYGYIGYPIYALLFGAAVAGMGVGVLTPFRTRGSMVQVIPVFTRRLITITLILYLLFTLIVSYKIVISSFRLGGY
ncbi:MAG: hypothetical protein P4L44_15870 [Oryzomonas sp.]|uniref:hypothetical protein n=1 Tax=Oryzomonas sp. TaxID=2855186 RepID=UPI0028492089|nr:hypothetical protein [Oryzomonas sp.]MDR3581439.1 hypothetical protein [Oryzomonas sp.]